MSIMNARKWNVCLLIMTFFFALGTSIDASNHDYVNGISKQLFKMEFVSKPYLLDTGIRFSFNQAAWHIEQPAVVSVDQAVVKPEKPAASTPIIDIEPVKSSALEEADISFTKYEVTAYMLNVRASANANRETEIINVVNRGSILEVVEVLENGWLKLKGEGYVYGKYTELIRDPIQPSASAQIVSDQALLKGKGEELEETRQAVVASPAHNVRASKPTSIVQSASSLTEADIARIFEGTALSGQEMEKAIVEIEEQYGINAFFTIAVMKLESGHGKSRIAQQKNNMFGLNAIDEDPYNKAFTFNSKGESIQKFGQLISENYMNQGLTSVEKVASKYCQANPKWSELVKRIMEGDYHKLLFAFPTGI